MRKDGTSELKQENGMAPSSQANSASSQPALAVNGAGPSPQASVGLSRPITQASVLPLMDKDTGLPYVVAEDGEKITIPLEIWLDAIYKRGPFAGEASSYDVSALTKYYPQLDKKLGDYSKELLDGAYYGALVISSEGSSSVRSASPVSASAQPASAVNGSGASPQASAPSVSPESKQESASGFAPQASPAPSLDAPNGAGIFSQPATPASALGGTTEVCPDGVTPKFRGITQALHLKRTRGLRRNHMFADLDNIASYDNPDRVEPQQEDGKNPAP